MDANLNNLNNNKLETSAVGVSVQAYSANLDEFASVNPTVAGLALLDDADAAAQRTTLGLAIGTDVQAYDADIPTVAASQAEMEAGTETALRSMSPERVAQAIAALGVTGGFTLGTPVATTSGTAIDITGIPSTATQIIVTLSGVGATSGVAFALQVGDSGGIETSGYSGNTSAQSWSSDINLMGSATSAPATTYHGKITLTKENDSTNTWIIISNLTGGTLWAHGVGRKATSAALSRIRLMGATFNAGEMNVAYI
jgi:hypothetical protein